jgi:ATP-dependent Clp protease ATP-binding subunit ClpA
MFERFTQQARVAVTNAVGEAERRGDRHVGNEHLLLAVIASHNPLTTPALDAFGVDVERARTTLDAGDVEALAAVGVDVAALPAPEPDDGGRRSFWPFRGPGSHKPFTSGAKQTLEATLRETLRLGDRHIGVEHLLLALATRTAPDPARHLLTAMFVDPAALRREIERRHKDAA